MERLLTITEVADLTRLKVSTIRKHVWKETMPFVKLGAALRFRQADIEAWVSCRLHGPVDGGPGHGAVSGDGLFRDGLGDDGLGAFGTGA